MASRRASMGIGSVLVAGALCLSAPTQAQSLAGMLDGLIRGMSQERSPYARQRDQERYATPAFAMPDAPVSDFQVEPSRTFDDGAGREVPEARGFPRADPRMTFDPLHDTTLQRGDAVVTSDGVRVFVGDPMADPHSPADFLPPSEPGLLDAQYRRRLSSIKPAVADAAPWASKTSMGRSVARNDDVVKGREIVDVSGRKVRYVGP